MARLRTGSRNRCARRPKAAEPAPRPMRKASRMMVKEKIDEPMMTARARVQSTCRVMAVAPETAKATRTARRAAGVMTGRLRSAGLAWAAKLVEAGTFGQPPASGG